MIFDYNSIPSTYEGERYWDTLKKINDDLDVTPCDVEVLRARSYKKTFNTQQGQDTKEELLVDLAILKDGKRTGHYITMKTRSMSQDSSGDCKTSVAQWNFFSLCERAKSGCMQYINQGAIQIYDTGLLPCNDYVGLVGIKLHALIATTSAFNNYPLYEFYIFDTEKHFSELEFRKGEKGDYKKAYESLKTKREQLNSKSPLSNGTVFKSIMQKAPANNSPFTPETEADVLPF